jgi:hypothetical protein
MKDYLLDLVEHTHDLGFIDLIKITGNTSKTSIVAIADDLSVVVEGEFRNPVPEFIGTFGMPNLNKLKILLNLQEYREDAKLDIGKNADGELDGIKFENKAGDFRNNYRFMPANVVTDKLKTPKFKGANWHVEFEPQAASIMRFKMQAQANAEEPNFQARTENGDLKFFFGDHSTHAGNFVFHAGVSGAIKRAWAWPANQFIAILSLTGDKIVRISDDGAAQITVDSGLAVYNYVIPAQSK